MKQHIFVIEIDGNRHTINIETNLNRLRRIHIDNELVIEHKIVYINFYAVYALKLDGSKLEILENFNNGSYFFDFFVNDIIVQDALSHDDEAAADDEQLENDESGEDITTLSQLRELTSKAAEISFKEFYFGKFKALAVKWCIWFIGLMFINFFVSDMREMYRKDVILTLLLGSAIFVLLLPLMILAEARSEYNRKIKGFKNFDSCYQKFTVKNDKYKL